MFDLNDMRIIDIMRIRRTCYETSKLNDILSIVNSIINDVTITSENIKQNLSELGMDPIMFIQIKVSIEKEYEYEISDAKLLIAEMDMVEKIMSVLQDLYDESKT